MKSSNNILRLGELIAAARKEKGYSQRKFAQISGLSNTTISRIENGETQNPDIETLKLIASHLDINEKQLIGLVDGHKEHNKPKSNAKINFLQQPVRKVKRYSTVSTEFEEASEILFPVIEEDIKPVEKPNLEKANLRGMHLITLRLEKNITQKELADALGIDRTLISQYEGEIIKPDYDTVNRLAEFFDVNVDYLINKQEQKIDIPQNVAETPKKDLTRFEARNPELQSEYLKIAKEIQESGVALEDVRAFIDMIKRYKR